MSHEITEADTTEAAAAANIASAMIFAAGTSIDFAGIKPSTFALAFAIAIKTLEDGGDLPGFRQIVVDNLAALDTTVAALKRRQ